MGVDVRDYIQSRIEGLTEDSQEFYSQVPGQANDFDTWSALKLILHSATVNMYTTVLAQNDYYDDLYYIDALAGSGVSQYNDENRCFLGSPLIAAKDATVPFKKMYFVEKDPDHAEALERRLEYAFSQKSDKYAEPGQWEVIPRDANKAIPDIISGMWRSFRNNDNGLNYLCFIDNQGMNVKWPTINELTPKPYGDLLINLPTSQAIGRNVGTYPETVGEFYGRDLSTVDIPDTGMREFMRDLYLEQLQDRNRPVQVNTRVEADVGSYYYDMIYATRDIKAGNGYEETIKYVRDFIEQVHSGDVDRILDVLDGSQSSLSSYLPDDDEGISEELAEESSDEDSGQTALGEFQ